MEVKILTYRTFIYLVNFTEDKLLYSDEINIFRFKYIKEGLYGLLDEDKIIKSMKIEEMYEMICKFNFDKCKDFFKIRKVYFNEYLNNADKIVVRTFEYHNNEIEPLLFAQDERKIKQ